jgi:hypothetical protein
VLPNKQKGNITICSEYLKQLRLKRDQTTIEGPVMYFIASASSAALQGLRQPYSIRMRQLCGY